MSMHQPDSPRHDLSSLIVPLLKGVIYRENDAGQWHGLLMLAPHIRDYVAVIGLDLILDESEGYAFLRSRKTDDVTAENEDTTATQPRLIARRPLSFPVSLLLALLRKKLAEFDASGDSTRLILSRDQIIEILRVFLPATSNEARLVDQIDTHLNKIVELGFLRRLKSSTGGPTEQAAAFEVKRILKAFVDAQWLADFDARLASYQSQFSVAGTVSDA
ncbi:DUF4194 domain-containing protein [Acidocella sp.]|uniref:DUF4194 domain-containing protein n=1 Tax=Acidocella sp. TaxID=50710 RepID=UPI002612CFBF|nr:DUF4194 domain-containing protein [Acidocella sp.]